MGNAVNAVADQVKMAIAADADAGMTTKELATKHRVSESTVRRVKSALSKGDKVNTKHVASLFETSEPAAASTKLADKAVAAVEAAKAAANKAPAAAPAKPVAAKVEAAKAQPKVAVAKAQKAAKAPAAKPKAVKAAKAPRVKAPTIEAGPRGYRPRNGRWDILNALFAEKGFDAPAGELYEEANKRSVEAGLTPLNRSSFYAMKSIAAKSAKA